jgi:ABC-type phosphate/phosphonate transport system substrate-binding protein
MYDLPPLRRATDDLWAGLARAFRGEGLREVPDRLDRGIAPGAQWLSPDLLFSQTCGYPLTHALDGQVTLLATPLYACPSISGPNYNSVILVRGDDPARELADLRGRRAAANARDSQSGYNALRCVIAPLAQSRRFFGEVSFSGGHLDSMAMVARGDADVCACDCVTFELCTRSLPDRVAGLRRIAVSPTAPNLPYVTCKTADADRVKRLRAGLQVAMADPKLAEARDALLLCGVEVLPIAAYDRILEMEEEAVDRGYPALA